MKLAPKALDLHLESIPGARKAPMAELKSPQLATLAKGAPEGSGWLHEIKFDGYRLLAVIDNGSVRLHTRYGHDWTDKFAQVRAALEHLPVTQAVLDGEAVVLDERGVSSFQALQNALDGGNAPLVYYVFDLVYCNGFDLTKTPLATRKELLKKLCDALGDKTHTIRFSDHVLGHGDMVRAEACAGGLEGAMSKRTDSTYVQKRSTSWLKVKCTKRQEFVIAGYTAPTGSRTGFGALLLGYYEDGQDGRLIHCGRVGTGFNDRDLARIFAELTARIQEETPYSVPPKGQEAKGIAHWVRPELVAEVEFTEWTEEGLLRHPSFKGLRQDKNPRDVRREEPGWGGDADEPGAGVTPQGGGVTPGKLTNPDRIVYPDRKLTKLDVAKYYAAVSEWMLPHIAKRPVMVLRCPQGQGGECFFQKHVNDTLPEDTIHAIRVEEDGETRDYIALDDAKGLLSLVQLDAMEFHTWASPEADIDKPDRIIFDLDPGPGVSWSEVIRTALSLRERLQALNLTSFVKTSGGKGLHIVAPIEQHATWDQAKGFAKAMADHMTLEAPDRFIATASKAKREGRIFVDYLRTGRGSTCVAAYSTRARQGAPVSAPIAWEELPGCASPSQFTLENLPKRLARLKRDPWEGFFSLRQKLPLSTS